MSISRNRPHLAAVFIMAAAALILFAELIFTDSVPFSAHTDVLTPWRNSLTTEQLDSALSRLNPTASDKNFSFHPDNQVTIDAFTNRRIPMWNRYQMAGLPHLGQSLYGIFYPLNPPLFLFDNYNVYTLLTVIHFIMAGFFTYLLLRRLSLSFFAAVLGGLVLICCATMTARFHLYMTVYPMAWAPLMLYLVDRFHRDRSWLSLCGLAILGAMITLAGFQQVAIYLFYLSLAYSLYITSRDHYSFRIGRSLITSTLSTGIGLILISNAIELDFLLIYTIGSLLALIGFFAGGEGFFRWIRSCLPVFGALVLAIGLSAVQLAPVIALLSHSTRSVISPESMVTTNSLPVASWLGFFMPLFLTDPMWALTSTNQNLSCFTLTGLTGLNYIENTLYIGILPAILAGCCLFRRATLRPVIFFAGAASLFLLLSFGVFFVIYPIWLAPGFQLDPRRSLIVIAFLLSILVAYGFEIIKIKAEKSKLPKILAIILLIAATVSVVSGSFLNQSIASSMMEQAESIDGFSEKPLTPDRIEEVVDENSMQIRASLFHFALAAGSGGIALLIFAFRPGRAAWALILVAIAMDLVPLSWRVNRPQEPAGFLDIPPSMAAMKKHAGDEHFRIFRFTREWESRSGTRVPVPPNITTHFEIEDAQGYIVQTLSRYFRLMNGVETGIAPPGTTVYPLIDPESLSSPILDLIGVRFILATVKLPEKVGFKKIYDEDNIYLYENLNSFPRAFMVQSVKFMDLETPSPTKPSAVLDAMLDEKFDLRSEAVVETPPFKINTSNRFAQPPNARVVYPYPEKVEITFDGVNPGGVLVLTDAYYPGWKAWADGIPTPVFPADLAFRGVNIPEGCKKVTFEFHPGDLKIGLAITSISIALLAIGAALCFFVRKARLK